MVVVEPPSDRCEDRVGRQVGRRDVVDRRRRRGVYGFRPRTWGRGAAAAGGSGGTGGATGAGAARRRRRRLRRRRVPPRGRRVGGRWGRTRRCRGCGRVVPGDGVGRGGIGPGPRRLPGRPARANATRAPRSCLVLRPMLARVRVLLGVERPVGARRRAVPRGTAPVGGEGVGIDIVVRGRPERRLLASSFAGVARLTGTRGPRTAACRAASVCRCRAAGALGGVEPRAAMAGVDRSAVPVAVAAGHRTLDRSRRSGRGPPPRGRGVRLAARCGRCRRPARRSGHTRPGSRGSAAMRPRRRRPDGWLSPVADRRV